MSLKFLGLAGVFATVALGLSSCRSEKSGEWVEVPNPRYVSSTRMELNREAWSAYRSEMAKTIETSNKAIREYLVLADHDFALDHAAPGAADVQQLHGVIAALKTVIANRRDLMKTFEAKVAEARDLCAGTRSWTCQPDRYEFSTSCPGRSMSDTCEIASQIRESADLVDEKVKTYEGVLRAYEADRRGDVQPAPEA